MANSAHVELAEQGTSAINAWALAHPSGVLDLSYAELRCAQLRGAKLVGANLESTHFEGADLRYADLRSAHAYAVHFENANLTGARLGHGSYLRDAFCAHSCFEDTNINGGIFAGARLTAARFNNAYLGYCNFYNADLTGASFREAELFRVELSMADLNSVDLTKAMIAGTVLADVDLRAAIGLESVIHNGPSSVDTRTLALSDGQIPRAFLTGCGMPEQWITYVPSLINALSPIDYYSCFISYSHANKSFAKRLHDALHGKGIRCWLDEKQIRYGDDIYAEVDQGLKRYDKVLLCASKESLESWWVEREIDRAFKREMELKRERGKSVLSIIPLDLDGYLFEWEHPHAFALQKRLAADFTDWQTDNAKFEEQFDLLVVALRSDDGAREKPPEQKL